MTLDTHGAYVDPQSKACNADPKAEFRSQASAIPCQDPAWAFPGSLTAGPDPQAQDRG
jgi:hypothetical protein